jgi:outer membrane protein assembly factor BamB
MAGFCLVLVAEHSAGRSYSQERSRWPAFQGPPAADLRPDELPLDWSPDRNVAWKAAISGYGQSSPVVWGSRVFVTSLSGPMKDTCHVSAIDLKTGKIEWQRDFSSATKVENSNYVSKAAPTPVADENGIVVFFEVGNLVALQHDGEVRWTVNLVEKYGELPSRHGLGSSLVQTDDLVIVWIERQTDPYLLAVRKRTGEEVWKSPGLGAASWSTPALVPVESGQHLVLSGSGALVGFEPQTGKKLWSFQEISGNTTPTPRPVGGGGFLIGATTGRGEDVSGKAAESNGLIQIRQDTKSNWDVSFAWRCKRATSSFGSPIIHDGLAYFVNATGVLFCMDAGTGAEVYSARIGDSIWATPLAVGDRIYFAGRLGTTTVVQAGREFRVFAQNQLWEVAEQPSNGSEAKQAGGGRSAAPPEQKQAIQYAIAAVPGSLLIRSGDTLHCIRRPVR